MPSIQGVLEILPLGSQIINSLDTGVDKWLANQ